MEGFQLTGNGLNQGRINRLISVLSVVVVLSMKDSSLAQGTLNELQANARSGNPTAQFILGERYIKGDGVPKNFDQGVKWLTAAANQRHGQAQLSLGILYFYGWGVPADAANARHWLERAAKNGMNEANFYLGKPELRSATDGPTTPVPQAAVSQPVPQAALQLSYQAPRVQEQSRSPRRGHAYDLRGIQLGMTLDQFRAHPFPDKDPKYPAKVFCTGDRFPKDSFLDENVYDEDKAIGLIKCNYYEFKPYVEGIKPSWQNAHLGVANVLAFMKYYFIPDPNFANTPRLFKIRAYYNVEAWPKFWAGYTGKYGQPDQLDNTPVQNQIGNTFDNIVATWRNEESSIWLHKRYGEIDISYIFYLHTDLATHVSRMREKVTGKPSDNL